MATDIPDWTKAVTVESGTVSIAGTAAVTITSGTVDANITNASVPISGSVSISSGTVDISAGTVDVQNAAGTVIATGNAIDFLVKFTKTTTVGSIVEVVTFTAPKVYGALLVVLTTPKTGVVPYCALAYDSSMASSHGWVPTFVAAFANGRPGQAAQYQAVVPFANDAGDKCTVSVRMSGTSKGTLTIYGLTRNPGVALRPDGRAHPLGSLSEGTVPASNATVTLVAAPPAPLRILIAGLNIDSTSPTGNGLLYGIMNGGYAFLIRQRGHGSTPYPVPPGGILLDPGTALKLQSFSAHYVAAQVIYDLVV